MTCPRRIGTIGLATSIAGAIAIGLAPTTNGEGVDFGRDVRPLLARRCLVCHGLDESTRRADLRLDQRPSAIAPRGDAAAIVPGRPESSILLERVRSGDPDFRMPPSEHPPLEAEEIGILEQWIADGAPYAEHWSWTPVQSPALPRVVDTSWARVPLDHFILSKLEENHVAPAPPADPATLLRRVSFDLTGLPPSVDEVEAFVADASESAYEAIVDRLLASPRFGERWARHWLDLVRYAETHGHEFDYPIRHAWRYRDYVIRALNEDLPYDQLITEHLAGDLLDVARRHSTDGYDESIIATGFWYLSQGTHGPVDSRADEAERIDNQIDVISKAFLATTVSCARCHDHKFDAVATADYYALAGFLQSSRRQEAYLDPGRRIEAARDELDALLHEVDARARTSLTTGDRLGDVSTLLLAAHEVLAAPSRHGDTPTFEIVEDFEGGYDGWTVEGMAFGDRPHTQETLAAYQGDLGATGRGFVNSHQTRTGADVRGADAHRGRLTSSVFIIGRPYLHFQIGGGRHPGQTALQVIVDGEVVREATGHDGNAMRHDHFDVTEWVGREARLRIIDEATGGWGNIGVDHLVLADTPSLDQIRSRSVADVARERGLDAAVLERWVAAVLDEEIARPSHPLRVWSALAHDRRARDDAWFAQRRAELAREARDEHEAAEAQRSAAETVDLFREDGTLTAFASGQAFTHRASNPTDLIIAHDRPRLALPGALHSGLVSSALQGTVRSPTFELTRPNVLLRVAGTGRVRLIVDGYVLDEFNPLLFEGLTFDVRDADGWRTRRQNVVRYLGHRAHLEFIDDGNASLVIGSVVLADDAELREHPATTTLDWTSEPEINDLAALAEIIAGTITSAQRTWANDSLDPDGAAIIDWLLRHGLLDDSSLDALVASYVARQRAVPQPLRVLAIADGTPEDERVFVRGSHRQLGPVAPRGFIRALSTEPLPDPMSGSGRAYLAAQILDDANPLTARVAVNRVWHHLFGRGIVPTTDDFGGLGQLPTHPELLDHLASWFRDDAGWSTKQLIRAIVTSSTYRMSSKTTTATDAEDPTNELFHRANIRRLQGEVIRDATLAISGRLDTTMYGPPIPVHLTDFMRGRGRPNQSGPLDGDGRRSIYLEVRRNFLSPFMTTFDAPIPSSTIGCRHRSNVPAQALSMLNDPFVVEQTTVWASTLPAGPPRQRIDAMYRQSLARPPTPAERAACVEFLQQQAQALDTTYDDPRVWADLGHVMLNLKEFLFLF